jgi:hypothetical protein
LGTSYVCRPKQTGMTTMSGLCRKRRRAHVSNGGPCGRSLLGHRLPLRGMAGCSGRLAQVGYDAAAESLGRPPEFGLGAWDAVVSPRKHGRSAWLRTLPAPPLPLRPSAGSRPFLTPTRVSWPDASGTFSARQDFEAVLSRNERCEDVVAGPGAIRHSRKGAI